MGVDPRMGNSPDGESPDEESIDEVSFTSPIGTTGGIAVWFGNLMSA